MSDMNVLIEQMVAEISMQAFQLEDLRLRLFLNWLMDHSSQMKISLGGVNTGFRSMDRQACFQAALKTWFGSLPSQGLLWEYRIVIDEIGWWRDLDSLRLKMIVGSDVEK
ncbi:MAG: hypothetical protein KPEEDBHJ_01225 [Anaerolineales bacterium]|nr:hypothetical protein [Anaerolineales bacterium]